jgi:catechol 2,3-dioxygenase-like lactoylglutathione lyase family enzyme
MNFIHIGLASSTQENADRFYGDLLGLDKTRESQLTKDLAQGLFGIGQGCDIVYYGNDRLVFEVFITGWREQTAPKITHTCIEVDDRAELLRRCREMGYEVREVAKDGHVVVFIADLDGNLFEVKDRR